MVQGSRLATKLCKSLIILPCPIYIQLLIYPDKRLNIYAPVKQPILPSPSTETIQHQKIIPNNLINSHTIPIAPPYVKSIPCKIPSHTYLLSFTSILTTSHPTYHSFPIHTIPSYISVPTMLMYLTSHYLSYLAFIFPLHSHLFLNSVVW